MFLVKSKSLVGLITESEVTLSTAKALMEMKHETVLSEFLR